MADNEQKSKSPHLVLIDVLQPVPDGRYLKLDGTYGRLFRYKGKYYNSAGLLYYESIKVKGDNFCKVV